MVSYHPSQDDWMRLQESVHHSTVGLTAHAESFRSQTSDRRSAGWAGRCDDDDDDDGDVFYIVT